MFSKLPKESGEKNSSLFKENAKTSPQLITNMSCFLLIFMKLHKTFLIFSTRYEKLLKFLNKLRKMIHLF